MPGERPHLIFLMADQLRADVLGPYAGPYAHCPTPNLDRLAASATVFERHLTPSPLCVPARSSIMTGREPSGHGAQINGSGDGAGPGNRLRADLPLLPGHLASSGYDVVHYGVQHVHSDPPLELAAGVECRHPRRLSLEDVGLETRAFKAPCLSHSTGGDRLFWYSNAATAAWPGPADAFFDMALTDQIVRRIQGHDPGRPLALFGMYWAPHPPFVVPEPWWSRFNAEALRLPPTVGRWCPGQSLVHLAHLPGEIGAGVPREHWPRVWAAYLGLVAMVDHCLGRVLDALQLRGMLEDALVVFTADHGEMLGCHNLLQKMCMYDEAVRVPLVVRFPGQTQPGRVGVLTTHLDLAPTLCAAAEAPALPDAEGLVLSADGPAERRPVLFSEYHGNGVPEAEQWMACSETYKLIDTGPWGVELYDLRADSAEAHNLAGDAAHRPTLEALQGALRAHRRRSSSGA